MEQMQEVEETPDPGIQSTKGKILETREMEKWRDGISLSKKIDLLDFKNLARQVVADLPVIGLTKWQGNRNNAIKLWKLGC